MKRFILPVCLMGLFGGCQIAPPAEVGSIVARGHKLAVDRCSDCHSVDYAESSPLPAAPSFTAIANTPGLTPETLGKWMSDHRNYPEEMYFEIPAEHIDELVAYLLTLRRPDTQAPS